MTRKRGRGDERGLTLILFTLMLTVLLVFVALAMDTGLVFNERRQDQSAVDSAVLAAAQILLERGTKDAAEEAIITGTLENTKSTNTVGLAEWRGKWATCSATMPVGFVAGAKSPCIAFHDSSGPNDPTRVWAYLPLIRVGSTFGGVVGINEYKTTAEATADIVFGTPYAVFANYSGACDSGSLNEALNIGTESSSANFTVASGRVHSNGSLAISPGTSAPDVTYVTSVQNQSPGVSPRQVSGENDPLATKVKMEDYVPTGNIAGLAIQRGKYIRNLTNSTVDNNWLANNGALNNGALNDVLIYSTGPIEIDPPLTGRATFVSERDIRFQGDGFDLEAWSGDPNQVLAFTDAGASQCDAGEGVELAGAAGSWTGLIYAPNGGVHASGDSTGMKRFTGSLVANVIDLEHEDYRVNLLPGAVGPPTVRLSH